MKLVPLKIEGAWLAESPVWSDERGTFREWFKREEVLSMTGIDFAVQQANISVSQSGVIRGIHYSLAPTGQAKWITCVSGAIRDVIVDLRTDSITFQKHISINLREQDGKSLLIGPGLGHAFITLSPKTTVSYIVSSSYNAASEYEVNVFDSDLEINWFESDESSKNVIMSEKDKIAPTLSTQRSLGNLPKLGTYVQN